MESSGRFLQAPAGSCLLLGPRGTGKSTWLRARWPQALTLDLLDAATQRGLQARPERLEALIAGRPEADTVVIDEVQRVPALLDVVHRWIESGPRPLRFVLTGSSARKLRRGAANLLAGRLVRAEMHPFMAAELGAAFDLQRALREGLVPLVWSAPDPEAALRSYAALYVREEVQAEALVRDVGGFARFLEAISFSHGGLLNLAEVARECEVGRKTVEGYVEVLEDLLLGFRVPVFARRARRQLVAHDKFYLFDAGLYRSLRPAGPLDRGEEIGGHALEGLVAQHLRAWAAYRGGLERLHHWRTRAGSEVDFVVYGPATFAALEVKRSARVERRDVRALKTFREDYPEATAALLYLGREPLVVDGIPVLPCETFLRDLRPDRALVPAGLYPNPEPVAAPEDPP
jgi:predicted AAA+ superfamily ATPase